MIYNKKHISGFTFIELVIVITIISMVSLATYLPYAHHQKKVLLKQASREISQSLWDARNLALNGFDTGSWNVHIGLYISSWATQLEYYEYPNTIDSVDLYALPTISQPIAWNLLKTKKLPLGIQIDSGEQLFIFDAISGSGTFLPSIPVSWELEIEISYKWAISPVLQKQIIYYPRSYISDY